MSKSLLNKVLVLVLMLLMFLPVGVQGTAVTKDYYRIVVASDVHFPSKFKKEKGTLARARVLHHKYQAVKDINRWQDVDLVVFTGDMIARVGTEAAYKEASDFTNLVTQPKAFVTGNHEYFFAQRLSKKNKAKAGTPQEREEEFKLFKKYFATPELYYTKSMGKYLLVFLSPDNPYATHPTEMSKQEVTWFKNVLDTHKDKVAVAFFHGPLVGTLKSYTPKVNTPRYIAEPSKELDEIILTHPNLKLWVSGHTHTAPTNPSFAAKINWYKGKVLDVHNPSWEGAQIWTNSLYLYPDKVVIKTYDHKAHAFVPTLTRTVKI